MAKLTINNQTYEIDGILFDKDGTLLDFRSLWVNWAQEFITRIISAAKLTEIERGRLSQSIGFQYDLKRWDPTGPLCIGSLNDLISILSLQLYQNGFGWDEALAIVTDAHDDTDQKNDWKDSIKAVSGLRQLLAKAKACSLKLGVVTSDNHSQAIKHLKALEIDLYFKSVIGHDQVERGKPYPDMVEKACEHLDLKPKHALIIGDSNGDMVLGKKSGTVASIGIVSEPTITTSHLKNADHIIRSFDDIIIQENN